jgi:hypothetical protein
MLPGSIRFASSADPSLTDAAIATASNALKHLDRPTISSILD